MRSSATRSIRSTSPRYPAGCRLAAAGAGGAWLGLVMLLPYTDHSLNPTQWATSLGVSREAIEIYLASDVIDLHVDTFIWTRIFGYDLKRRHGRGPLGPRFLSQVDFPRTLEARLTGAIWVITTNPLRPRGSRSNTFINNLKRLRTIFDEVPEQFSVVRNVAEYRAARALGKHGAFIGIQGGNALDAAVPEDLDRIPDGVVLRITLVHLSNSTLGSTSAPMKGSDRGLTTLGRDYVKKLNELKIFLDLAHVSRRGFWDAVEVHDASQPILVTHTGVTGVHDHWRNLDDAQLRKVADLGGTVGIMFQSSFLTPAPRLDVFGIFQCDAEAVVRHATHVRDTVGEDHVSLGSDFDGMITPPRDLPSVLEYPRLVQLMLDRDWTPEAIQKCLGGNFLRVVAALRG